MSKVRIRPARGFTLIELMIVIGIIGILAAILLKATGGSTESARAAKCLAHMHNLAAACHSVGMSENYYPAAGSREYHTHHSRTKDRTRYSESKGWVSWYSKGSYPWHSDSKTYYATAHKSASSWNLSTYEQNIERRTYCLTNGAIWRAAGGSGSSYVCPEHKKLGRDPAWSYVMNSYFGWDETPGTDEHTASGRREFKAVKKTDRLLLFAELPFNDANTAQTVTYATTAGTDFDPTLQYPEDGGSYKEVIGFNHKVRRKWHAHVCFADGHTEKLEMPGDSSPTRLRELTKWLCEAVDFTYDGSRYRELTK